MKALITLAGAGAAIILGVVGLGVWFASFLQVMAVLIPVMLIVGSGLAITIGRSEVKGDRDYSAG